MGSSRLTALFSSYFPLTLLILLISSHLTPLTPIADSVKIRRKNNNPNGLTPPPTIDRVTFLPFSRTTTTTTATTPKPTTMATKEQKLELIRENLAEVLNPEIIDEVLEKGETLRIYWGE